MTDGRLALVAGALLLAAVGSSLIAARLRLPSLLLFLTIGMVVGSDGAGWVQFDDYALARDVGTAALAVILFDGGLSAGLSRIRPVLVPALRLAVGGTIIGAVLIAVAAAALFHLSRLDALIVGSVLSTTDSAAIFGVLRGTSLDRKLTSTLEGEAGFNDPVAVLLVVGFINWSIHPGSTVVDMLLLLAQGLLIGGAVGLVSGVIGAELLRRLPLPAPGLYPVASAAIGAIAFGGAEIQHGSGFLAIYVAGLILGDDTVPARRTIATFHQGLAWVAQVSLFLLLGLLAFPSRLSGVVLTGLLLALFVVLVARPLSTLIVTSGGQFTLAERFVLAWAGLRGATPVVFATYPVTSGIPGGTRLFDLVFLVAASSTLIQGVTFEPVARALGLTTNAPPLPQPLSEYGVRRKLGADILEYTVSSADAVVGRQVRDLGLPPEVTVNTIVRHDEIIQPRGSTRLNAGDEMHLVVTGNSASRLVPGLLERWRNPGWQPTPPPRRKGRQTGARRGDRVATGAWDAQSGDPSNPAHVGGARVIQRLRVRRGLPGALVALDGGELALTGPSFAIGDASQLRTYAMRRAAMAPEGADALWWREIVETLKA